jgi:hypothetical protein
LLLRLRVRALAGVAALAAIASIFSNVRAFNFQDTCMMAAAAFAGLPMSRRGTSPLLGRSLLSRDKQTSSAMDAEVSK